MADTTQQTAEDQQAAQEVAAAGIQAKAAGGDTEQAMREKRDEIGFTKLSDDDIEKIAARFNDLNIEAFAKRGAFDPPPEPTKPPPPDATAPPPPSGNAETATGSEPAAPQKRNVAQRFFGS